MSANPTRRGSTWRNESVLITGACSGLGEALALALAERGANLALMSIDGERQERVAEQCRELGVKALAVTGDVTSPADCRRFTEAAVNELGRVDAFVANAGISQWARFDESENVDALRRLIDVNYLGAVNGIQATLPALRESRGLIVAVTSIQAWIGVPLHAGYVASKHALQGFCDSLRLELDGTGVDVLTVLPHWLSGTQLRSRALDGSGEELGTRARSHGKSALPVDRAALMILEAMAARRRELVMPWYLRLLAAMHVLTPPLADALIARAVGKEDRR